MAYRKVFIAVDCTNEAEFEAIQQFGKELSSIMKLRASDVLRIAPMVRKNSGLIMTVIRTISAEGAKGVAKMIPYFMANVKK